MAGISHVFTISRVAEILGEDEDLLQEISIEMDPEDGRLTVLGPGATGAPVHQASPCTRSERNFWCTRVRVRISCWSACWATPR